MRFVPVEKAKGLDPDKVVFTHDADGNYGVARLVEEKRTRAGKVLVFEAPQFFEEGKEPAKEPTLVTNIVAVCVPKTKKEEAEEAAGEDGVAPKAKGKGGNKKKDQPVKD